MAIDSISSVSPIMAQGPLSRMSRPQETTPDARVAAAQENDARNEASAVSGASPAYQAGNTQSANPSVVGTRTNASPVVNDAEGSLREASAQISRATQTGSQTPVDMRAASQAYSAEASARDEIARQQQGNGARTLDVLA
jgi:hypothetical protein